MSSVKKKKTKKKLSSIMNWSEIAPSCLKPPLLDLWTLFALIDWLIDRLIDWLTDWLIGIPPDCHKVVELLPVSFFWFCFGLLSKYTNIDAVNEVTAPGHWCHHLSHMSVCGVCVCVHTCVCCPTDQPGSSHIGPAINIHTPTPFSSL